MSDQLPNPAIRIRAVKDAIREQTAKLPVVDNNGYPLSEEAKRARRARQLREAIAAQTDNPPAA